MTNHLIDYPAKIGNTFQTEFNLIRLLDRRIINSRVEFSADLEIDENATADDQVRILSGINKWFSNILNDSIAFCSTNEISLTTLKALDNNLLFCPEDPYDHLLLLLIVAKLNAIGSNLVKITHSHLLSDLGEGYGNWFEGDPNELLPSLNEWLGEITYFDKPWWNRSDGSTLDMVVGDDDDPNIKPDILINLWDDDVSQSLNNKEPAEIIKHNFNPTIISND